MRTDCRSKKMNRREFLKKSAYGSALLGAGIIGFPAIVRAKTDLRVGYIPILDHMTLMVSHARDNDGFKTVNVKPRMFKSWSSLKGALKAGVVDAAYLLAPAAMDQFNKGVDIRSIIVAHRNGSAITTALNSGISSPADLKGKKIAIPSKLSTHKALLDQYLKKGGLTLDDVETRVIAPPDMPKSMKAGRIDAFIVAEPFCAKAESMGVGETLVLSKEIINRHVCCVVVARKEALAGNREGIVEWLASIVRSSEFIEQDKFENGARETAEIVSKYTPHKPGDIVNGMMNPWDRIIFDDLRPRKEDYRTIADISTKAGLIQSVDLDRFVDGSLFDAIV